jgi:hypothetical protein
MPASSINGAARGCIHFFVPERRGKTLAREKNFSIFLLAVNVNTL